MDTIDLLVVDLKAFKQGCEGSGRFLYRRQFIFAILAVATAAVAAVTRGTIAAGSTRCALRTFGTLLRLLSLLGLLRLALLLTLFLPLRILAIALGLLGGELLGKGGVLFEERFLAAEADALGLGADLENLAANHIANLELIFDLRNAMDRDL